jgi:hypothetical protein
MLLPPPTSELRVTPDQVWPALSHDLRTRVIGLLAELALKVLVALPANDTCRKESGNVVSSPATQNPS